MATITTRAGKGSPLTNTEVDDNFTNLNTDKAELSGSAFTGNISTTGILGVGTASPDYTLDIEAETAQARVHSTVGNSVLRLESVDIGESKIYFADNSASAIGTIEYHHNTNHMSFSTVATTRMLINSSGNVGINTTNPHSLLHVDGGDVKISSDQNTSNGDGKPTIFFSESAADEVHAAISYHGDNKTGNNNFLGIGCAGGNATTQALMKEIHQMAITAGGLVGIGTTSPDSKLHVKDGDMRIESTFPRLYLADTNQNSDYSIMNSDGSFSIYDDTNAVYRMRIDSSGNVLIGTTAATPNAKLKVTGAAILNDSVIYTKNYSVLDTTGNVVAKATGGANGSSTTFIFTGQGGGAAPFHIVFACINAGGQWSATRLEIAASSSVDVVASTSGNDVLFTFKSKSGTQSYSPKVKIETVGSNFDTTYLA